MSAIHCLIRCRVTPCVFSLCGFYFVSRKRKVESDFQYSRGMGRQGAKGSGGGGELSGLCGIFLGIGERFGGGIVVGERGGGVDVYFVLFLFSRLAEIAFLIATGLQRILVGGGTEKGEGGWCVLLVNGSVASIFPQEVLATVSGRRRI